MLFTGKEQVNPFHHEGGTQTLSAVLNVLNEEELILRLAGDPLETIVSFAREDGREPIIVGTRWLVPVAGLRQGSVAAKTIHLAEMPEI